LPLTFRSKQKDRPQAAFFNLMRAFLHGAADPGIVNSIAGGFMDLINGRQAA
jgi:hypothetical protein